MGAVTAAVIGAAATIGGTALANKGNKDAAKAAGAGDAAAIAEQRRQFDLTRQDHMPWLESGKNALSLQNKFLSGDWSGFENSPDYKYVVDQGFRGLDRGAAAGGRLYSGGADADRIALGQGLALQNADRYWNKLAGLSNTGQATAGQLGQFGANAASNIGGYLQNSGNARASAYQQNANNFGNALSNLGGIGAWYVAQRGGQSSAIDPIYKSAGGAMNIGYKNNLGWKG